MSIDASRALRHRRPVSRERLALGSPDVASLVAAAAAGDTRAFGTLHDLFARMVHAVLLARVPVREAEDLVQDVFLTALRKIGQLRDPAAFAPWIARIARNRAMDYHRRGKRHDSLSQDVAEAAPPSAEAKEAIEAIRALPDTYREPLLMRLVEGMSGPEIAARTGMTPGSVRVNLHRGMKLLRERLGMKEPA